MSPAKKKKDLGLIVAIVFAAVIVSGSLVFFALQLAGGNSGQQLTDEGFAEMVERYAEVKEKEQMEKQLEGMEAGIRNSSDTAEKVSAVTEKDHVFGNPDAKVTLIEYSDFQCPFCTRFHATAKNIIDNYDGDVNWVYRHFPLSFHEPAATKQARASECVAELGGNDSFWEYVDLMFNEGYQSDSQLAELASDVGVSESAFTTCLESDKYEDRVAADIASATDIGVTGTPGSVIINNETGNAYRIDGAREEALFNKFIDEMLAS